MSTSNHYLLINNVILTINWQKAIISTNNTNNLLKFNEINSHFSRMLTFSSADILGIMTLMAITDKATKF